jgi:hypothetical protein
MTRIAFSEATNLAVAGDKFCSSPPRICRTAFLTSTQELNVEIPLNLTEATIGKQVKKLLRNHPSREVERRSSAKRPLAKFTGIRSDLLQLAHMTWQMHCNRVIPRKHTRLGKFKAARVFTK